MFNFLHHFHPQPILLKLGPLEIHWYGFLMVVGGLIGLAVILSLVKKTDPERKLFQDLLLYFVVGAVIGARIYYVTYAWEMYRNNLFDIFKIWQGGLAIHGIMLGGFAATYIFCRMKKQSFWRFADFAAIGLAAAQAIGRAGNYFNQEIFGTPTALPWGIPIDEINRPAAFLSAEYFHPVFLYECFGNMLIAILLYLLMRRRLKTGQGEAGIIFFLYLILYSAQRFFLEFLRVDYSPFVFGMRWAQLLSVGLVVICGFLIVRRMKTGSVGR